MNNDLTPPPLPTAPYAGFWLRFVAFIIDVIVGNILAFMVGLIGGVALGVYIGASGMNQEEGAAMLQRLMILFQLAGALTMWLYFAIMESSPWRATLGKKALGLYVTDIEGRRIGFLRAMGRYLAKCFSAILLCIGFMMAGWTQRKQALHDMMASTLVYRKS